MDAGWGAISIQHGRKKLFVLMGDECKHVWHTAISEFNIAFVAYLVESMMLKICFRIRLRIY